MQVKSGPLAKPKRRFELPQWLDASLPARKNSATTTILRIPLTVRAISSMLVTTPHDTPHQIWDSWNLDLNIDNIHEHWKQTCGVLVSQIVQVRMRSFYLRYMYRAYSTNIKLKIIGARTDDYCSFCHNERETRIHLYWECPQVLLLWIQVIEFCKKKN